MIGDCALSAQGALQENWIRLHGWLVQAKRPFGDYADIGAQDYKWPVLPV